MEFQIKHRFNGSILFTASIEAGEDTPISVKLGLAVKAAVEAKANLRSANLSSADLSYADLRSANLSSADLRSADLSYADLRSANLSYADLRSANLRSANLRSADLRYADLSYADLRSADLRSANLRSADLRYADLSYADLSSADLRSADLRSADLRTFKADLWMILTQNPHEVPALITALKEGRVDGSTYRGACACLVGTIANARGVHVDTLEQDSDRPAERWFMMIREGDKPEDETGGGFASKTALSWAEEWLALTSPAPITEAA